MNWYAIGMIGRFKKQKLKILEDPWYYFGKAVDYKEEIEKTEREIQYFCGLVSGHYFIFWPFSNDKKPEILNHCIFCGAKK